MRHRLRSQQVYEGGREVCEQHGLVLYAGPTDEQQRLGDFKMAVYGLTLDPDNCPSFAETRGMLRDLLDEHGLTDWRVVESTAAEYGLSSMQGVGGYYGDESCHQFLGYVEEERLLVLDVTP